VFLGSLIYAVIQGPDSGWTAPLILALFAVAAASLAAFVAVERHHPEPLLELRFFRSRPFTGASVIAVLAFIVLGGFLFVITLYLQQVRGDSPLRAGLSLLPAMIVMALAAPVAGQITGRHGPRVPLVASGLLIAAGMALLLDLGPGTSFTLVAVALAITGTGLGLVNPPITNTGVSGMPPAQAGVASAVISATRQFGSVLGVAVMGDLVTTGVTGGMARGETHAVALSAATHGAWAVAVGCGLVIALTGYLTTTARAHATAAAIAATPPAAQAASTAQPR
jgi:Na+/melibiose symporter-like transporter